MTTPAHPTTFRLSLACLLLLPAGLLAQTSAPASAPSPVPDSAPASLPAPATQAQPPLAPASWAILAGPEKQASLGSLDPKSGYLLEINLTARGAALQTAKLAKYFQTVEDKQLYEEDPENYPRLAAEDPQTYKGHYAVVQPATFRGVAHRAMSLEELTVTLGKATPVIFRAVEANRPKRWILVETRQDEDRHSATWEWAIYRSLDGAKPVKALTVRKTYTVRKGSYSVDVALSFENHTDLPMSIEARQEGMVGLEREDTRGDMREAMVARMKGDAVEPEAFNRAKLNQAPYAQPIYLGRSTTPETPVLWVAMSNKYFAAIQYLRPQDPENLVPSDIEASWDLLPVMGRDPGPEGSGRTWVSELKLSEINLGPAGRESASRELSFELFLGPKLRDLFSSDPHYQRLRYIETVATGGCAWCTFDWLRNGLMWLLTFFARTLFFGNYGLAIFLLVAIVRVVLHPLTKKGMIAQNKMQKQMQALRPQMEKVKEKYKDDRAAQQRETMKLYKEHGNPMGGMLGCLPMFLQMPIWIALYSGLNSNVALRHAGLLPFWINDLAAPDALFSWSYELPLIGTTFNLLPLLLCGVMFLQMKFNPAMAGQSAAVTPEQQQQQKMMKLLMPLMMLVFFYKAPSGLNLYIMCSTAVGVAEQYFIRKHIREAEEVREQSETVVKVSGKGPRDSRPKKPKGPFWTKRG